ncbi:hypothetical protein BS17DRAFT_400893 [Gyrodon lividus]|nr:hypothetical protein BS17DRAFT_400893 [Gyrodon lividus]
MSWFQHFDGTQRACCAQSSFDQVFSHEPRFHRPRSCYGLSPRLCCDSRITFVADKYIHEVQGLVESCLAAAGVRTQKIYTTYQDTFLAICIQINNIVSVSVTRSRWPGSRSQKVAVLHKKAEQYLMLRVPSIKSNSTRTRASPLSLAVFRCTASHHVVQETRGTG